MCEGSELNEWKRRTGNIKGTETQTEDQRTASGRHWVRTAGVLVLPIIQIITLQFKIQCC